MSLPLTRPVPKLPLPSEWADGPTYAAVERIIEGLTNAWSVSAGVARVLARLVVEEQRTRILEFGAGMSSRMLAAALEEIGGGRLTSVEENPAWCEEVWALVEQSPNVDAVLVPASVHLKVDGRGVYYGYAQVAEIEQRGLYDLVFVDAPWGGYGRDGALHAAIESVGLGGLIVLDDAQRVGEQRVLRRWMLNYPNLSLLANDSSVGRGLAILRKERRPMHEPPLARSWVEVWGSGIYETVRMAWAIRRHRSKEWNLNHARNPRMRLHSRNRVSGKAGAIQNSGC